MAIKHTDPQSPNDPTAPAVIVPGYQEKRGKILPTARPWGTPVDGMGRKHDPDAAKHILDEALK